MERFLERTSSAFVMKPVWLNYPEENPFESPRLNVSTCKMEYTLFERREIKGRKVKVTNISSPPPQHTHTIWVLVSR